MRRATTIVVVPSRTIEKFHEPPAETQAYEERLLCLLLKLRERNLRMVYVTSMPVAQEIVEYYLGLLPADVRDDARDRLTMLSTEDAVPAPALREAVGAPDAAHPHPLGDHRHQVAHLIPYVTTELEFALGKELGIPVMGADPALAHLGTKSGGAGVVRARRRRAPARGSSTSAAAPTSIAAIARLRAVRPRHRAGGGQARRRRLRRGQRDRRAARPRPHGHARGAAEDRRTRRRDAPAGGQRLARRVLRAPGAGRRIVEERIVARELRSPSVQLELEPEGGRGWSPRTTRSSRDDRCVGCRFPAAPAYAGAITESRRADRRVARGRRRDRARGDRLHRRPQPVRRRGTRTRSRSTCARARRPIRCTRWSCVTGGAYDPRSGRASARRTGRTRHYVATDYLASPRLSMLGDGALLRACGSPAGWNRTAAAWCSTCSAA